jgi:hypothetical protein
VYRTPYLISIREADRKAWKVRVMVRVRSVEIWFSRMGTATLHRRVPQGLKLKRSAKDT